MDKQCIHCGSPNPQDASACQGCGKPFGIGPWHPLITAGFLFLSSGQLRPAG